MTQSYFIRHAEKLGVQDDDVKRLWEENKVAIHYPGFMDQENNSLDPEDYKDKKKNNRGAYSAMKVFNELNESGGYIWAEYRTHKDLVKIGRIKRGSAKLFDAKWVQYDKPPIRRNDGAPTKLKSLQMEDCREINLGKGNYWFFIVLRPPFLTICRWRGVGKYLKELVEYGRVTIDKFESLHYKIQEVVCSEFLRSGELKHEHAPKLKYLLLQVGGPLKDIDICGYSDDGKMILAQVTNYEKSHPKCEQKKKALRNCPGAHNSHLVLFCKHDKVDWDGEILYVPGKEVFQWLKKNREYYENLIPSSL
ncbi:MAG: hypothetical protein ACPLYF_03255 [Fervidobacterium sp.]